MGAHACGCAGARTRVRIRARPLAREKMCFSSFKTPEISNLIRAFRINGTNGMQSGVHGERARLARRAVRPARHIGRPQAFGTPWVAACISRGRGLRHARRVRSPNHASLLFQPLFPVSLFLKDRVLIRLPDTLRRTDSLEGRKAGKTCRKRSFSAFLPSKSALCQATGYAGGIRNLCFPIPLPPFLCHPFPFLS